jgi:hypothetical protein
MGLQVRLYANLLATGLHNRGALLFDVEIPPRFRAMLLQAAERRLAPLAL